MDEPFYRYVQSNLAIVLLWVSTTTAFYSSKRPLGLILILTNIAAQSKQPPPTNLSPWSNFSSLVVLAIRTWAIFHRKRTIGISLVVLITLGSVLQCVFMARFLRSVVCECFLLSLCASLYNRLCSCAYPLRGLSWLFHYRRELRFALGLRDFNGHWRSAAGPDGNKRSQSMYTEEVSFLLLILLTHHS